MGINLSATAGHSIHSFKLRSVFTVSKWALACFCASSFIAAQAVEIQSSTLIERLEKGETLVAKTGDSFVMQTLANKDPEKIKPILNNLKRLPELIPSIAFVRPYTSNGKNLIYMKLKGLGDGVGVVAEVKSGGAATFNSATQSLDGAKFVYRNTAGDVDLSQDAQVDSILKAAENYSDKTSSKREVEAVGGLILEGPLNPILQLPNLRVTISLGIGKYSLSSQKTGTAATTKVMTLLITKAAFGSQGIPGYIGDGFGRTRFAAATQIGMNIVRDLKTNFEGL